MVVGGYSINANAKTECGLGTDRILEIGRRFQQTDGDYRGATYETAKLLCDEIERLRDELEMERKKAKTALAASNWGCNMKDFSQGVQDQNWRPADDPEFISVKCGVDFITFVRFMADKELADTRLPLNNEDACRYLRWLNLYYSEDNPYLNYILNKWDETSASKRVRPPTPREYAIVSARHMVRLADSPHESENHRGMFIDFYAESIRDAYFFCRDYPTWISRGLAGCVMKWGTFEDNMKDGDDYMDYATFDGNLDAK